jgi:hypothetical protein
MESITKIRFTVIWLAIFFLTMALSATQLSAAEKVQLEGTIRGAKCTHFKVKCYNDDNHIALEPDFVFVMPNGDYYFMPNLPRDVKTRHAYEKVLIHGELKKQELWVDKLVDLDESGAKAKTTWDWTDRLEIWEAE